MARKSLTIAVALLANLVLLAPSRAGSVLTLTAIQSETRGANDFEATFTGTGGSIADVMVAFSGVPVHSTSIIDNGTGFQIDFKSPLPHGGGLVVQFESATTDIALATADWTYNTAPTSAPATEVALVVGAVPEPCSLWMLGIGAVGLVAVQRVVRKRMPAP